MDALLERVFQKVEHEKSMARALLHCTKLDSEKPRKVFDSVYFHQLRREVCAAKTFEVEERRKLIERVQDDCDLQSVLDMVSGEVLSLQEEMKSIFSR